MSQHEEEKAGGKTYRLHEALAARQALRRMAELPPEMFPVDSFVGMISDEVEELRRQGHTDDEIAAAIEKNSAIRITGEEIAANYASPEARQHHG